MATEQASAIFEFASHSSSLALRWRRGAHAIKVRSTGLTERRRKLLQVPCRNTRYQRIHARSNFTLAEHQRPCTDQLRSVLLDGMEDKYCERRGERCRCVLEEGAQPLARGPGHDAAWRRTSRTFDIDACQRSAWSTKGLRRRQRLSAMQRCCPAIAIATSPRMHACSRAQNFLPATARHYREAFSDTLGHGQFRLVRASKHT